MEAFLELSSINMVRGISTNLSPLTVKPILRSSQEKKWEKLGIFEQG